MMSSTHSSAYYSKSGSSILDEAASKPAALNVAGTYSPVVRVAIFTPVWKVRDGVTLTLRKIRRHLVQRNVAVRVYTALPGRDRCDAPADTSDPDEPDLVHTLRFQPGCAIPHEGNWHYGIGMGMSTETIKDLELFSPTVVHVTSPDFMALEAIQWAHDNDVALMATWHSNFPEYTEHYRFPLMLHLWLKPLLKAYFRSFYSRVPIVFAPQKAVATMMEDAGYKNSHTRNCIGLWGRGVNTAHFNPKKRSSKWRASHGFQESDFIVLWVGRCVVEKSPDTWITVVRALREEYGDRIKALVVGRGWMYDVMTAVPGVTGLGWVGSADHLGEIYANADLLVFPSRVETFGNVTLEAMASGTPVVADRGCSGHLVENGETGFSIESSLASDYLSAVRLLVDDTALLETMSKTAAIRAERNYSLEAINDSMLNNYCRAANEQLLPAEKRHFRWAKTSQMRLWDNFALVLKAIACIILRPDPELMNDVRMNELQLTMRTIQICFIAMCFIVARLALYAILWAGAE